MKERNWIIKKYFINALPLTLAVTLAAILLTAISVLAATGTTDAPAAPGSTGSYTLEDIYRRQANGTAATQSTFSEPGVAPGTGSMHTLNDIYSVIPEPASYEIKHGVTLLGVTGTYTGPGWYLHTTTAEVSTLQSVSMLSATDVWAVGASGRIYHYVRKRSLMANNPSNPDFNLLDCPTRHFSFLLRGMEIRTQMPPQSQPGSDWRFSLRDPGSEVGNFELLVDFMQNLQNEQSITKTDKGNDKNEA